MRKLIIVLTAVLLILPNVGFAKTEKKNWPNGKTMSIYRYNKQQQLNGEYRLYWPNGNIKEIGRYKNGKINGPIKRFNVEGQSWDKQKGVIEEN